MLSWEDILQYYDVSFKTKVGEISVYPDSGFIELYQSGLSHLYDCWIRCCNLPID